MRVRPVGVVEDPALDRALVPVLAPARRWYPFPLQGRVDAVDACAFRPHHAKDAAHHRHLLLVHLVAVPGGVDAKAVGRSVGRYHLALARLLQLAPAAPLHDLRTLVFGELVEDAVREVPLRAAVSPVVWGPELAAVLLELQIGRASC